MLSSVKSYHRPTKLSEALDLIRHAGVVPLGGGTHLMAARDPAVKELVDLARLGLTYVEAELERVRIGATTTLQQLADAPEIVDLTQGLIGPAVRGVAARNVRCQATIGGAVATGGGENPLLALLLVLDAAVVVYAPEERTVSLDSFLTYQRSVLDQGGLITEIVLPRLFGRVGLGLAQVARTPADRPIVCALACVVEEEGRCREARLALAGVAERPVRAPKAEHLLKGRALDEEHIAEAARLAVEPLSPAGDFRGSGPYRRRMAAVLLQRATKQAVARLSIVGG